MIKAGIKPTGPALPRSVPKPGSVSAVGPSGAAPKVRIKNTRDYGKPQPPAAPMGSSPSPFGPVDDGGL